MSRYVIVLLMLVLLPADAALSPDEQAQLRQMLRLPRLGTGTVGIGFSFTKGIVLEGWTDEVPRHEQEIRTVLQALKGDASDAERYQRLAALYSQDGDDANARRCIRLAVGLYRDRGAAKSKDAAVVTAFARALFDAGEFDECEPVARRAAGINPKDWQPWSMQGSILSQRAFTNLWGSASYQIDSLDLAAVAARANRFPTAAMRAADKEFGKAMEAADRALALAPNEPKVYFDRLGIDTIGAILVALKKVTQGADWDASRLHAEVFSTNTLNDLWRIADLTPHDPKPLLIAAMFEFTTASLRGNAKSTTGDGGDQSVGPRLSSEALRKIRQADARLRTLSLGTNKATALNAAQCRGLMQYVALEDPIQAESVLKRVLAEDPSRESVWALLCAIAAEDRRFGDVLSFCETRLKAKDDAKVRVAQAKACVSLNRLEEAGGHAEKAVALSPDGFESNLAAGVIAMKRSADRAALTKAARHFNTITDAPGFPASRKQEAEYAFDAAILALLAGSPEAARVMIHKSLKHDPDDMDAKAILALCRDN